MSDRATPPGPRARGPRRPPALRHVAAALLGGLAALPACSPSIWTDVAYDSGQPALRFHELPDPGEDKSSVLASLGPPGETIAQPDGDIWVYRLRVFDQRIFKLDTGYVSPVGVPVYVDVDGSQVDRTLFVFFTPDGRVARLARTDA